MAIQVSGVNVIDNQRNLNVGILTATSLDVPPAITTFSPTDGSSDVTISSNIVITYNTTVAAGSGNITIRDGSASGTILETIAVSSGNISISGGQVTINPSSDFPTGKDLFVVVPAGGFTSSALGSETELLDTYNFTTGPITTSSFSPSDGATSQAVDSNIVITFSENITKGSGNITIRSGSASGTAQQTIDVTSGAVSVSGTQATINPPSDLAHDIDTFIVVDAGCFRNADGDVASGNAIINTYNFTTLPAFISPGLGNCNSDTGGYLICCSSNNYWIVAKSNTEVCRTWYNRSGAVNTANASNPCGDWFVPSASQLINPGWTCRTYWESYSATSKYWSDTQRDTQAPTGGRAWTVWMHNVHGQCIPMDKTLSCRVRAFRCVTY